MSLNIISYIAETDYDVHLLVMNVAIKLHGETFIKEIERLSLG